MCEQLIKSIAICSYPLIQPVKWYIAVIRVKLPEPVDNNYCKEQVLDVFISV